MSEKIQKVKAAMIELGYTKTKYIELEELDNSRSKVIYDGHFIIGIYDFERHTFID